MQGCGVERFFFQLPTPIPKIIRKSDSQQPSLKNPQTFDSTSLWRKIFRSTPNFQLSVLKIVRESNSQLPSPKNRPTLKSDPDSSSLFFFML